MFGKALDEWKVFRLAGRLTTRIEAQQVGEDKSSFRTDASRQSAHEVEEGVPPVPTYLRHGFVEEISMPRECLRYVRVRPINLVRDVPAVSTVLPANNHDPPRIRIFRSAHEKRRGKPSTFCHIVIQKGRVYRR